MAKVRFVGNGINKVLEIKKNAFILESALNASIEVPYGCRYGACFSCSVEVMKGFENIDSPITKIEPKNKNKIILTCISKIKNDADIVLKI